MTSEPEKLLPCPFCGNTRPTWVGCAEGDYVECGSCLAVMPPHDDDVPNETARWNTRLSSPVSGRSGMTAADWVNSIAGVKPSDQFIALDRRLFEDCIERALSASPTPPIPMIAEAGEREALAYRYTRPNTLFPNKPDNVVVAAAHHRWKNADGWTETPLYAATPAALDNTAVEVETGPPCVGCGKPVAVGQVVLCYDDAGEVHADCERPYRLVHRRKADDPVAMVLLGSPMVHVPLATLTAKTEKAE